MYPHTTMTTNKHSKITVSCCCGLRWWKSTTTCLQVCFNLKYPVYNTCDLTESFVEISRWKLNRCCHVEHEDNWLLCNVNMRERTHSARLTLSRWNGAIHFAWFHFYRKSLRWHRKSHNVYINLSFRDFFSVVSKNNLLTCSISAPDSLSVSVRLSQFFYFLSQARATATTCCRKSFPTIFSLSRVRW